jgi:hypothetical protein
MSKKKNKFDLTYLVTHGYLKEGQSLFFVSDPAKSCKVARQPNGEYKVTVKAETMTVHAFSQQCLGQDPPDHASKWLRTEAGKTLYELWHAEDSEYMAA